MNRWMIGVVACVLLAQGCATVRPASRLGAEVTFVSAEPAPTGFSQWFLSWPMPEIDPDAELEYVIVQPNGQEYYRETVSFRPFPGYILVSAVFPDDAANANMDVFFGKHVKVVFRVSKGHVHFKGDIEFAFTSNRVIPGVQEAGTRR